MSEFAFINQLKNLLSLQKNSAPDPLNLDDDICILGTINNNILISSSDSLCEDIHFFKDDPIDLIIKKAIRCNISDIACKGAVPYGIMLNICLPKRYHNQEAQDKIHKALQEDLAYYKLNLLGGDTTSSKTLTLSVTIFGLCQQPIALRKNMEIGDSIYVTGILGLSKIGLDLRLQQSNALAITGNTDIYKQAYLLPNPPLMAGIALAPYMNASMDISDGLVGDLQKMVSATKKNIGFEINDNAIPKADIFDKNYALQTAGGDDYQILFTSQHEHNKIMQIAQEHQIKITKIGVVIDSQQQAPYQGFSHL